MITKELSKQEALELAVKMLQHIRDGGTYGMIDYHEKLAAIEKARGDAS